jgi:uncharacterized repeat protein (TIGR01451 family)
MRYWIPLLTMLAVAMCVAAAGVAAPTKTGTGSADLKVTKTDGPDPVSLGSTLTYTIQVENLGPDAATGVVVTDPLPKEVDYVSATSTQGKCTAKGKKVTCELGTMSAPTIDYGGPPTVTIAVIPRKVGTISNTASVDGVEKDPVDKNNKAMATTTVVGPTATCRGVPATIVGTGGNDALVGTTARDVIAAFGGDDSIASLSGRDLVCAGRGSDRVGAGSAADRVFGGAGKDRLLGRGGPDVLRGGAGGDILKGNAGNDRLRGGSGTDRCVGGAGADSIRGCESL